MSTSSAEMQEQKHRILRLAQVITAACRAVVAESVLDIPANSYIGLGLLLGTWEASRGARPHVEALLGELRWEWAVAEMERLKPTLLPVIAAASANDGRSTRQCVRAAYRRLGLPLMGVCLRAESVQILFAGLQYKIRGL